MRILMVGDVIGRPGRAAFAKYTPKLRQEKKVDLVVVNGENSAEGRGVTKKTLDELFLGGADVQQYADKAGTVQRHFIGYRALFTYFVRYIVCRAA